MGTRTGTGTGAGAGVGVGVWADEDGDGMAAAVVVTVIGGIDFDRDLVAMMVFVTLDIAPIIRMV